MYIIDYYNHLCLYYFNISLKNASQEQWLFIKNKWELLIDAHYPKVSLDKFDKLYGLRMKLIQPPENLK